MELDLELTPNHPALGNPDTGATLGPVPVSTLELIPEVTLDNENEPTQQTEPSETPLEEASLAPASTPPLDLEEIQSCIEALLFMSDKPLSKEKLHKSMDAPFDPMLFDEALAAMAKNYQGPRHGVELIEVAGGYQLRTKLSRAALAQKLVRVQTQRLSAGSMETLAIVAYKQPVMKEEVDKIRGVDSSYFIRGLMDRKLIQIEGRSELPGRPLLYTTTAEFLEIFGLKDLSHMPSLRELEQMVPSSESGHPDGETPQTRELRKMVNAMNLDRTSELYYNPKEDESILKDIREKVSAIATSTPYLDELRTAEILAKQQQAAAETQGQLLPPIEASIPAAAMEPRPPAPEF